MRPLRSLALVYLWFPSFGGWAVDAAIPANTNIHSQRAMNERDIQRIATRKHSRKEQEVVGGGKGRTKAPTSSPSSSPTRSQASSPSFIFVPNPPTIPALLTGSPVSAPELPSAPTYSSQAFRTISNRNGVLEATMCETDIPISASPIVESVLYFRYKLTLPDTSHETQLRALEPIMNQELSKVYLADCMFYDDTTFSVYSLSTDPPDQLSQEICGDNCRFISAGITIKTFYILLRRRRNLLDDPLVAESFGNQLRWILAQLSSEQLLWELEFVSLAPLGSLEAPTFDEGPDVAAAISQSQERQLPVSWGAAVLGLAAVSLLVVAAVSIRHRRRLRDEMDDKAGLHETYLADQERYTYDGGDGVQYLVNDELVLDANGCVEAVNGGGWTLNELNETPPPPRYVQVQRPYETPDTLDL